MKIFIYGTVTLFGSAFQQDSINQFIIFLDSLRANPAFLILKSKKRDAPERYYLATPSFALYFVKAIEWHAYQNRLAVLKLLAEQGAKDGLGCSLFARRY